MCAVQYKELFRCFMSYYFSLAGSLSIYCCPEIKSVWDLNTAGYQQSDILSEES